MILYNTTFFADKSLENELIDFLKTHYVPASLTSGMTHGYIGRVRGGDAEEDAVRIAVHLIAPDESVLKHHCACVQPEMLEVARSLWGERVLALPTAMDLL